MLFSGSSCSLASSLSASIAGFGTLLFLSSTSMQAFRSGKVKNSFTNFPAPASPMPSHSVKKRIQASSSRSFTVTRSILIKSLTCAASSNLVPPINTYGIFAAMSALSTCRPENAERSKII